MISRELWERSFVGPLNGSASILVDGARDTGCPPLIRIAEGSVAGGGGTLENPSLKVPISKNIWFNARSSDVAETCFAGFSRVIFEPVIHSY